MFLCYYVAWPCDLDLLPFDLESVSYTVLLMSDPHTNVYNPMNIGYWVTSTKYLITFPLSETVTAHIRRVTWPLTRGKNSPHFWNPWPQFVYSLCHSHGPTTKIKPCYRRIIAFSHCEGYKVHCACAVSRDLCIGGPPKLHVTIFWPRIAYSLYNFYGATMTIKGSLHWSIPTLKRFSVAKTVQSKSVPEIKVIRKFRGLNRKCRPYRPPKGTSLPGTTSFDVFCVNIRSEV